MSETVTEVAVAMPSFEPAQIVSELIRLRKLAKAVADAKESLKSILHDMNDWDDEEETPMPTTASEDAIKDLLWALDRFEQEERAAK